MLLLSGGREGMACVHIANLTEVPPILGLASMEKPWGRALPGLNAGKGEVLLFCAGFQLSR